MARGHKSCYNKCIRTEVPQDTNYKVSFLFMKIDKAPTTEKAIDLTPTPKEMPKVRYSLAELAQKVVEAQEKQAENAVKQQANVDYWKNLYEQAQQKTQ